jgi:hypothetical protein
MAGSGSVKEPAYKTSIRTGEEEGEGLGRRRRGLCWKADVTVLFTVRTPYVQISKAL